MIFDPEMLNKMATDWDPEPFNQALDQAQAQQMAASPIVSNFGGPVPGANPMTGAPPAPGMNFAQMLGGSQGMIQQPAMPMASPPQLAMPGAPNVQSVAGPRRPTQVGQVPDLATILGRR